MRIKGTILMLFIILLFINGCYDSRSHKDAKTCVHLVSANNERYSLVYYGERCPHQDFIPLQENKYDQVFSWAYDTSHAGIISHLDHFMIISRLATLEKRSNIHFVGALSGICPLIEHKWSHFADHAYLGLHDGPTRDDVRVAEHLEKPLLEKKFVKADNFFKYTFISRKLSNTDRIKLGEMFCQVENLFASDINMTTPTKTLDQAVNDVDKKEYWSTRRTNFTKFRIDSNVVARHTSNPVLLVGKDAKISGEYEIPVNNMEEFNFKTKKEIYDLRKQRVFEHSNLVASYEPSEAVFGHIVDKIPWWGIYGIYGYGNGIKSIEGPSEESRFLLNPYLLVGLSELNAFTTSAEPDRTSAFYPKPIQIHLRADASSERIEYYVSEHFHYVNNNRFYQINQQKLMLITYNARDMGFSYLYIDPKKSDGLIWANKNKSAVPILDYIHRGTSCGFPETGCNNASPFQQDLVIDIKKIPAKAHIKLWRTNPQNVDNDCNMTVIIEMQ